MRITIYALHLGFGGVEKYVSNIANMLSEKHEVRIISTYRMNDKPAFYIKPEVHIEYLIENLKPNQEEFKSAIKEKNIKNIFAEGFRALKILRLKKKRNIESIKKCNSDVIISTRTFHNFLIGKYADKSIIKITSEHNHHNNNDKYINEVVNSCKGFDFFLPISKELCDFYNDRMKTEGVETKYIRYCHDQDIPAIKKPEFKSKDLIYIGRLSQEKGVYELLDVFKDIYKSDRNVKLHIVGDGSEANGMKNKTEEYGISQNVVFHGFQNKEYIYNLLPECSLYVMTSFTESFGIVLLESMSCGIPCIAYDSAQGAHEIIEDGVNGYLIKDRNHKHMVEKINTIISSEDELHRLSQGAYNTADTFSYENTKENWLDFMEKLDKK